MVRNDLGGAGKVLRDARPTPVSHFGLHGPAPTSQMHKLRLAEGRTSPGAGRGYDRCPTLVSAPGDGCAEGLGAVHPGDSPAPETRKGVFLGWSAPCLHAGRRVPSLRCGPSASWYRPKRNVLGAERGARTPCLASRTRQLTCRERVKGDGSLCINPRPRLGETRHPAPRSSAQGPRGPGSAPALPEAGRNPHSKALRAVPPDKRSQVGGQATLHSRASVTGPLLSVSAFFHTNPSLSPTGVLFSGQCLCPPLGPTTDQERGPLTHQPGVP